MTTAAEVTLSAAELSAALAMTPRRLNQLVAEGVVTRGPGGRYTLEAVREYVVHLKRDEETRRERRALLRAQTAAAHARTAAKLGHAYTLQEVRERLEAPTAALLEIRNAASWNRGRLIEAGIAADLADRLAREQWAELAAAAADVRRQIDRAFAAAPSAPREPAE